VAQAILSPANAQRIKAIPFTVVGIAVRTSTIAPEPPFNFIKAPTDILFDVLLCRCRYKMSYRVNSQEGERCLEHLN
jgi:hypothetical protein